MNAPTAEEVAELVRRTAASSGVPEQLEDIATIERVASIVRAGVEGHADGQ